MSFELAVIVTTYQRPRHLHLVLESILAQLHVAGRFELCVTDDGSVDETASVVRAFSERASFPVSFVTHEHVTFEAARCRNDGVRNTTAPHLLFLDGDCLISRDHLAIHLQNRKRGVAMIGDAARLDEETSEHVDGATIDSNGLPGLISNAERRRLRKVAFKYGLYNLLRHPTKPYKLRSGNFAIGREDFERVNGFDEHFQGWGGEDDDLGRRLRRAGVRLESIVRQTHAYHLWHPREITAPDRVKLASNTQYLWRADAPIRCLNGLKKLAVGKESTPNPAV
jgi:glycosyltransferase involved in cell wall biosynthesis